VSLILTEEHRLKAFQNRMLRRIFGPKREEVVRGIMRHIITYLLYHILLGSSILGG
jgi:hypothetical protein